MIQKPLCMLDMDGVLYDFVGSACKEHNLPSPYGSTNCNGVFEMETCWGMTEEQFWAPIKTREFWEFMPKTPEADDIVNFLIGKFGEENICILSNPSAQDNSIGGKKACIKRDYPMLAKSMLFGSAKQFLAGPGRYLVDDRDKTIIAFESFGGVGITVPRSWNRMYFNKDHVMREIKSQFWNRMEA